MAQDALLLLEDEQALAIHPDGDGLVVFDGQTGEGSECCCGGVGACCQLPDQGRSWASIYALSNPKDILCGPTKRVDLSLTGRLIYHATNTYNGSDRTVTVDVSHSLFWEVDENDPSCVVRWGEVGKQSRSWHHLWKFGTFVYRDVTITEDHRRFFPAGPLGHDDDEFGIGGLAMWALFAEIPSQRGAVFDIAFDDVLTNETTSDGTGYQTWGRGYRLTKMQSPFGWSTKPINEAAGNFTYNKNNRVASLAYQSTMTCDGGSHIGAFSDRITSDGGGGGPPTVSTETYDVTLMWSTKRTPCGGSTGAPWPGCAAFLAAFIAGDPAADIDGDGFITGKDYDLVLDQHPECGSYANTGSFGALVQGLRIKRRDARRGALTAGALLGLGA